LAEVGVQRHPCWRPFRTKELRLVRWRPIVNREERLPDTEWGLVAKRRVVVGDLEDEPRPEMRIDVRDVRLQDVTHHQEAPVGDVLRGDTAYCQHGTRIDVPIGAHLGGVEAPTRGAVPAPQNVWECAIKPYGCSGREKTWASELSRNGLWRHDSLPSVRTGFKDSRASLFSTAMLHATRATVRPGARHGYLAAVSH